MGCALRKYFFLKIILKNSVKNCLFQRWVFSRIQMQKAKLLCQILFRINFKLALKNASFINPAHIQKMFQYLLRPRF